MPEITINDTSAFWWFQTITVSEWCLIKIASEYFIWKIRGESRGWLGWLVTPLPGAAAYFMLLLCVWLQLLWCRFVPLLELRSLRFPKSRPSKKIPDPPLKMYWYFSIGSGQPREPTLCICANCIGTLSFPIIMRRDKMLRTSANSYKYLLLFGIPSPTHSFFTGLKPSFSKIFSHCSPSFLST